MSRSTQAKSKDYGANRSTRMYGRQSNKGNGGPRHGSVYDKHGNRTGPPAQQRWHAATFSVQGDESTQCKVKARSWVEALGGQKMKNNEALSFFVAKDDDDGAHVVID